MSPPSPSQGHEEIQLCESKRTRKEAYRYHLSLLLMPPESPPTTDNQTYKHITCKLGSTFNTLCIWFIISILGGLDSEHEFKYSIQVRRRSSMPLKETTLSLIYLTGLNEWYLIVDRHNRSISNSTQYMLHTSFFNGKTFYTNIQLFKHSLSFLSILLSYDQYNEYFIDQFLCDICFCRDISHLVMNIESYIYL